MSGLYSKLLLIRVNFWLIAHTFVELNWLVLIECELCLNTGISL